MSRPWALIDFIFEARTSAKSCLLDIFAAGKDGEGCRVLIISRAWVYIDLVHDAGIATRKRVGKHLANGVFFFRNVASGIGIKVGNLNMRRLGNGELLCQSWVLRLVMQWRRSLFNTVVDFSTFRLANAVAKTWLALSQSGDVVDWPWGNGVVRHHFGDGCMIVWLHFLSDLERE